MSALSHSRHFSCVIQQTCLLCDMADDACCVAKQIVSGTKGRILEKAANEKVPYIYIYIYILHRVCIMYNTYIYMFIYVCVHICIHIIEK